MTVVFLNHWAGAFGGVEAYVRRAAAGLSARGVRCVLGYLESRDADPTGYLAPFSDSFRAADEAGLAARAAALAPDAVFIHKLRHTTPVLALRGKTRLVRYVHDHDLCCPRRHKYFAWNGAICERPAGWFCHLDAGYVERRGRLIGFRSPRAFRAELQANRELDLLLVGSDWMRRELLMNGFERARVAVLPPSTPEAPARDIAAAAAAAAPDPAGDYILYVGQLIRGKGVDLLIDAFARLRAGRPGLRLVIAGSGNAGASLRARAAADTAVQFAGQCSERDLEALYAGARLLAVPSRWPEPFGMVGLEAMRRGLPVVAFASGGIPDWLQDGRSGILAPPGDVPALAAAMARILDDTDLARRMGEEGRAAAASKFSFSCSMDQLVLYLSGRLP